MTRRLANLQFQRDVLRLGVEADLLGDLLYTLPADAHVVGFSEDLFTQTVNIVVQSDRFPERVVGSELPSFTAIFEVDEDGNTYVTTDIDEVFPRDFDMPTDDDVIGDEDKIRGMEPTHCYIDEWEGFKAPETGLYELKGHIWSAGTEKQASGVLTAEMLQETKDKFEEHYRAQMEYSYKDLHNAFKEGVEKAYQDSIVTGTGLFEIPKYPINQELLGEFVQETQCSHQWEHYTGLNETFEYCVHCDEKRNIRKG